MSSNRAVSDDLPGFGFLPRNHSARTGVVLLVVLLGANDLISVAICVVVVVKLWNWYATSTMSKHGRILHSGETIQGRHIDTSAGDDSSPLTGDDRRSIAESAAKRLEAAAAKRLAEAKARRVPRRSTLDDHLERNASTSQSIGDVADASPTTADGCASPPTAEHRDGDVNIDEDAYNAAVGVYYRSLAR
jgi:hypothetical protein